MTKNYASDLHRKGELSKIEEMEQLANSIVSRSKGNLGSAFVTTGYYDADAFCIIANSAQWTYKEGYVVYDEELQETVFIKDEE